MFVTENNTATAALPSRERLALSAGGGLQPQIVRQPIARRGPRASSLAKFPAFRPTAPPAASPLDHPALCGIDTMRLCRHRSAMHRALRIAARRRRRLLTGVEGLRTR